jgi:hypothetical protein
MKTFGNCNYQEQLMNKKIYVGIVAAFALILVLGGILATASVEAKGKAKAAKIFWSQPKVEAQFNKADVIQTTLSFTPTGDITNASFRVSDSLSETVMIDPPTFAALTAGTPYQVTVTFTAPNEGNRKKYHGVAAVVDETKLYAKPLKLRFGAVKTK